MLEAGPFTVLHVIGGVCRWKANNCGKQLTKVGRHVGLDFYDLLIEGDFTHDHSACPVHSRSGVGHDAGSYGADRGEARTFHRASRHRWDRGRPALHYERLS